MNTLCKCLLILGIIIILVIIIFVCCVFINCDNTIVYNFPTQIGNALGNRLCEIFAFKMSGRKNVLVLKFSLNNTKNEEIRNFYNNVYKIEVKSPKIDIRTRKLKNYDGSWNPEGNDKYYSEFITFIKNNYQNKINNFLPFVDVKKPVFHFRCSDAPINNNPQYHFPKLEFIDWVIEKLDKSIKDVIVISCLKHKSNDKYKLLCKKYLDFYIEYLYKKHNINTTIVCNSILEDFSTMLNAPILVSLIPSSFSVIAGILNENRYISPNLGKEKKGKYSLGHGVPWEMYDKEPLLHSTVKKIGGYENYDEIIKIL